MTTVPGTITSPSPQRRSRGPAALHAGVVVAVLVLIAAVALHAAPPAPPPIAEFAPQPQKQITQAPQGQSSKFGNGANGAANGGVTASTPPATPSPNPGPSPTPAPAQFACYTWPNGLTTQSPDPQSPPCRQTVPPDNGGATSHGVSRTSICIGVPNGTGPGIDSNEQALANYFNATFNFSGRKISLIREPNTDNSQDVVSGEISNAKMAGTSATTCGGQIFASMPYVGSGSTTGWSYQTTLAQYGVISVAERPMYTNAVMNSSPYIWQYNMAFDDELTMLGQTACAQLNGANAVHAGDANLQAAPRKFGVMIGGDPDEGSYHTDPSPLLSALAACGISIDKNTQLYDFGNSAKGNPQQCSQAALQMKNNGVTTIISVTEIADTAETAYLSTQNSYHPEWFVPTYSFEDIDWWIQNLYPSDQRSNLMTLSFNPKQVLPQDDPFFQALSEGAPGSQPPPQSTYATYRDFYHALLLLASGIQMAGPDLTPSTFASALQGTQFPNPDTRIYAGHVGFQNGHAMTDDAAEMWYSNGGTPPYPDETNGAYCYVNHGQRIDPGAVPRSRPDPFFAGACDSGA